MSSSVVCLLWDTGYDSLLIVVGSKLWKCIQKCTTVLPPSKKSLGFWGQCQKVNRLTSSCFLLSYKGREIYSKGRPTGLVLKKWSESKYQQPRWSDKRRDWEPEAGDPAKRGKRWSKGFMVDRRKFKDAEMEVILKKYYKRHCLDMGTL